jgi:putative NIF3 family GTP cyclohydrolase 1 type 2
VADRVVAGAGQRQVGVVDRAVLADVQKVVARAEQRDGGELAAALLHDVDAVPVGLVERDLRIVQTGQARALLPHPDRVVVDVYITSDLKYHDFFTAENQIIIADIGHYESEQYTKNFLADYLSKKFTNFAVVLSTTNTNPVKYL